MANGISFASSPKSTPLHTLNKTRVSDAHEIQDNYFNQFPAYVLRVGNLRLWSSTMIVTSGFLLALRVSLPRRTFCGIVGRHYRVRELLRTLSCLGTGPCSTVYLVWLPRRLPRSSSNSEESRKHRLRLKKGMDDLICSCQEG